MSTDSIARIIEILEEAENLFKALPGEARISTSLWEEGLEKLTQAIWAYEKETEGAGLR
ncbi:MAG: hypothetical protein ACLGPL_08640 [Acidobacteriota bacterium]